MNSSQSADVQMEGGIQEPSQGSPGTFETPTNIANLPNFMLPTDPATQASNSMTDSAPTSNTGDQLSNMEIDEDTRSSESDGETTVHAPTDMPAYQPTQEEIDAAALFDEHNQEDEGPEPVMSAEYLADLEMAQMLQALENGAGEEFGIPRYDQDMAPEMFECVCGEAFTYTNIFEDKAVLLPCNHARCIACLNENVQVGLESKRNFPPRCCTAIDVNDIAHHLTDEVLVRWSEVREEYEDIAPVYCAVKACSQYLTKRDLIEGARWALCSKCNTKTCTGCLCLESAHIVGSSACPERIDKMDKDLMHNKGWKPCPGCGEMVEKIDGCDHMTCDCGQDFCYLCGRKYEGGMPCNCDGQREWVDEDPNANDPQAQQQILDNIANPGHHQNDEEDSSSEDDDDEDEDFEDEDEEDEEEGDVQNEDTEGTGAENAENQQGPQVVNTLATTVATAAETPDPAITNIAVLTEYIRRLRTTSQNPILVSSLENLVTPQNPLLPHRLPGVAATLRVVTGFSGEELSSQLDEVRNDLTQSLAHGTMPVAAVNQVEMQDAAPALPGSWGDGL